MIKLVTDSACDLPRELVEQYGITVLPMNITFGEETFLDQAELSTTDFYQRLTVGQEFPRTAYPALGLLQQLLAVETAAGNQVIVITLADALSGFYKASQVLVEDFAGHEVAVFDSKSATMGQGLIVLEAARLIAAGQSYEQVLAAVPGIVERSRGFGTVDNLDYLRRGGRINLATAKVASALNIKPIIEIRPDGSLEMVQKVRGIQKAVNCLVEKLKADATDFTTVPLFVGYIVHRDIAEQMLVRLQQEVMLGEVMIHQIGPTVGTHLGPGCIAFFYMKPEQA